VYPILKWDSIGSYLMACGIGVLYLGAFLGWWGLTKWRA